MRRVLAKTFLGRNASPPDATMDPVNVRALVTAAREVTHATSNLSSIAAEVAHRELADSECQVRAMQAASRAAKLAFVLDDIYRAHNGSAPSLRAAEDALAAAEEAIAAARAAVAKCHVRLDVAAKASAGLTRA